MKRADYAYHPTVDGSALRKMRMELGMTIPSFSKLLGISPRMCVYYEDGTKRIPKSIGFLAESMSLGSYKKPQGTLTSFEDERIRVLADAMYQYASEGQLDQRVFKLLGQAVKEIDLLLSKFE